MVISDIERRTLQHRWTLDRVRPGVHNAPCNVISVWPSGHLPAGPVPGYDYQRGPRPAGSASKWLGCGILARLMSVESTPPPTVEADIQKSPETSPPTPLPASTAQRRVRIPNFGPLYLVVWLPAAAEAQRLPLRLPPPRTGRAGPLNAWTV